MGHQLTGGNLVQVAQFCTILVGFLGIAVALRSNRRQMNAQMYIEFSARFQEVVWLMPVETWTTDAGDENRIPPPSADLTRHTLQWFLLLANLYQLHKHGYVSNRLWGPSQRGVKRMPQSPLLKREWSTLEKVFAHDPHFCRYVHAMIHRTGDNHAAAHVRIANRAANMIGRRGNLRVIEQSTLRTNQCQS